MSEASKTCSTCGEARPLTAYAPDRRKRDGRQARCLICHRAYQKRYKLESPDSYKATRGREYEKAKASGRIAAYRQRSRERERVLAAKRRASMSADEKERRRAAHRATANAYRDRNPDLCNERIANWKLANPGMSRHYVHVRRAKARSNGAPERFTRQEIGERDGWICGICGESVDPALRWPDRMSQSLDHIRPLSLGGEHTRANSRISHYICNVRRGARVRTERAQARQEAQ